MTGLCRGSITGTAAVWSGGRTGTSGAGTGVGSNCVIMPAGDGSACEAGGVLVSGSVWPRTTSIPLGTAVSGEGRVAVANRISSANRTVWPATDKASGSLILSTASAPRAVARSAQEYRNRYNFAAVTASPKTRMEVWQIFA